jgi:hypothetical protein
MPKKDASKAEFVRALPDTMPAKQVVEKAKDAGLKISTAYVYVIRSQARVGPKKPSSTANGSSSPRAPKDVEARLIAAASEIGLTRSIEILTQEKARVMRLLR